MEKTLKIIRELKEKGIIKEFAIGGGIAVLYYVEPLLTYDLDIFFIPAEERIDILCPIYNYLKAKGYQSRREHLMLEGVPVQFIPAYNDLIEEAVLNSADVNYGRVKTKILCLEYLMAIMVETFRPKDKERIIKILGEAKVDTRKLEKILKKYGLYERYSKFKADVL